MSSIKSALARKAVKTTARHSARGTASKLKRSPARTASLLAVGCAIGVLVGWFANRPATAGETG